MKIEKFQKLRPVLTAEDQDKKLQDVAKLYEKQFLREIVKSMRDTTSGDGLVAASYGEKIFKDQLDHEYVEKWGESGGIGLSKLIYNQMMEKYGAQMGLRPPTMPMKGPVSLQKTYKGMSLQIQKSANPIPITPLPTHEENKGNEVLSPWYGKVLKQQAFDEDQNLLQILHDNGMNSQLVFRGKAAPDLVGKEVQEGERLGVLSNDAKTLYWNFDYTAKGPVAKTETVE